MKLKFFPLFFSLQKLWATPRQRVRSLQSLFVSPSAAVTSIPWFTAIPSLLTHHFLTIITLYTQAAMKLDKLRLFSPCGKPEIFLGVETQWQQRDSPPAANIILLKIEYECELDTALDNEKKADDPGYISRLCPGPDYMCSPKQVLHPDMTRRGKGTAFPNGSGSTSVRGLIRRRCWREDRLEEVTQTAALWSHVFYVREWRLKGDR